MSYNGVERLTFIYKGVYIMRELIVLMGEIIKCQQAIDEEYEKISDRLYRGDYVTPDLKAQMVKKLEELDMISTHIDEELDSLDEIMDKMKA